MKVVGLPLSFLDQDWVHGLLNHVGYVDQVDTIEGSLPLQSVVRALVFIDLSRPLIAGCLPHYDDHVILIYFRYEGVFKFCKSCGCVGHSTVRCNYSQFEANRRIHNRLSEFEKSGFKVLYGLLNSQYYTNLIIGSPD